MNRLQKKCLIATAGSHFLLIVILLVGPGFFTAKPKPDDTQVLDVIPANLIDAAFMSGVKNATPPPPTPPVIQPPEPTPPPPPPQQQPKPPEPKPEPVKPPEPEPPLEKISPEAKPKPKTHEVKPDLTRKVVRKVPVENNDNTEAENEAKEQKRLRDQHAKALRQVVQNLKNNFTTGTVVEMPGPGSVSYANYASAVKSKYEAAWIPPNDSSSDDANVKVSVTIARDGTVVSSRILERSDDAKVDGSVQRTLDRVTFVAPFPDGAKEKERTFIINFNLKAKRMLG